MEEPLPSERLDVGTMSPSAAAPPQHNGSLHAQQPPGVNGGHGVRERSGTVALFATLAEGMAEMQRRVVKSQGDGATPFAGHLERSPTAANAAARRDLSRPPLERSSTHRDHSSSRHSGASSPSSSSRERERDRDRERERERRGTAPPKGDEKKSSKAAAEEKREGGGELSAATTASGQTRRSRAGSDSWARDRRSGSDACDAASAVGRERRGTGGGEAAAPLSPATPERQRRPSVGSRIIDSSPPSLGGAVTGEKREARKDERKKDESRSGGIKAKGTASNAVSGGGVNGSAGGGRRSRSGSMGEADKTADDVVVTAKQSLHRRSRSRGEVRLVNDLGDLTSPTERRRERRGSDRSAGAPKESKKHTPVPMRRVGEVSPDHQQFKESSTSTSTSASCSLADRMATPRVTPLNLTRRPPPAGAEIEDDADADDQPKSGRSKSLLDKVTLLLSPGRRQQQRDELQSAAAVAEHASSGSRSQQGSRRPSNSSLAESSVSGNESVLAQLNNSGTSSRTKTPRDRARKDSGTDLSSGSLGHADWSRSSSVDAEDKLGGGAYAAGGGAGGSNKDSVAQSPPQPSYQHHQQLQPSNSFDTDDAIAPKRRAVMALRKRFNSGGSAQMEPALKRTEKSKQLKQLAPWVSTRTSDPLSLDDPELSFVPGMIDAGEAGLGGRSGRSASNPNVSRAEMLRVKWEDCTRDELDLEDQIWHASGTASDEMDMVRGVGVGNAIGMGTVLVRDEQSSDRDAHTDPAPLPTSGVSLPRRVLRSSSQNARLSSMLDQSFVRRASPITLEQLLRNASMRKIFHHHVEKTFCAENIEFYVAVHRYKNLFPNAMQDGAMDTVKLSAAHIYSTFMAPDAAKQINVDVVMGRNVQAKLDNPTKDMFDESQKAIQELVHCSILPKFYQSTEFRTTAEFEEVKQALVVENEKLRRMQASVTEQRNRIALLEQKRAMLHQYYSNFEETAAELSRKRREKELRLLSEMGSAYDPYRGRETVSAAKDSPSHPVEHEKSPALRRWALWSDQAKAEPPAALLDHFLCIEVVESQDLVARDKRGFSNPYVVVKYGKQKYTTRTVFKNLNPRWREHFIFNVKQEEAHKLWLTVWDYNVIGSGEFLGCLSFASPRLFINSSDRWWTLEARKDGELVSGKIRLIIHYRKQEDRDQELESELQKVRNAIREEMVTLQKTSPGLWAGRPHPDDASPAPKDQVEKLVRTLNERRQKLEKEVVDRDRDREREAAAAALLVSDRPTSSMAVPGSSSPSPSSPPDTNKSRTSSLS